MRTSSIGLRRHSERGGVAVEAAILLPILILFLAVPLFFARVFWYYSVAQKAAHDAARFLATASQVEMMTLGANDGDAAVAVLAKAIVLAETEEIRPMLDGRTILVQCDQNVCGWAVPQTVRVSVRLRVSDNFLGSLTDDYYKVDGKGLNLTADVSMGYAGK
jgi:Flp pilus assembly protein TadG